MLLVRIVLAGLVNTVDCDWAAYGLFLTMGKGYLVHLDDGTDVHCFPFLEPIGTEQVSIQ
jgi:hypothetical protein